MRFSKAMASKVAFAKFCINNGLDAVDGAELITLAETAHKAGTTNLGKDDAYYAMKEQVTADAFTRKAIALGFTVEWNGLYPSIFKNGYEVHIPS